MTSEYATIGPNAGNLSTNKVLAKSLATLYKNNNCWTWYDDYEWCDHEAFVLAVEDTKDKGRQGSVLPLNMIDVGMDPVSGNEKRPWFRRLKLKKKIRKLLGQKTRSN